MTPTPTPPAADRSGDWLSLKALCASHGRSFGELLEHYTRHANGAELGIRRSVAADLVREWEAEDAVRSANEKLAAQRAAEKAEKERSLREGLRLLEALDAARFDQAQTEGQIEWESGVERLAMLERRLEGDLDAVQAALEAWTAWKASNETVALAVEQLHRTGATPDPEPEGFVIPKPDWQREAAEQRRLAEREMQREREVMKQSLRAELAAERGA